jgi:hypothetical protein
MSQLETGTDACVVPWVVRGELIEDELVEHPGRGGSITFQSPDPRRFISRLALPSPALLSDLYTLSIDDILDFLEELGSRLDVRHNAHLQWAKALTYETAARTPPLIDNEFASLPAMFDRAQVREKIDSTIGLEFLEGWVEKTLADSTVLGVRAFGARAVHVIPGNGALAAARTIITSAMTRSDCIIKTPSNNPFAPVAIARTMVELAPEHPITRHVAVGYWRGGDTEVEEQLYQPHHIEKVIAWGGFASVKHVTRYIQPGLELISLDPKYSVSVIGAGVLDDEVLTREAALRLAVDVGTGNQGGCSCPRVAYVVAGSDDAGLDRLNHFGDLVYEELIGLPETLSTKPKHYDPELRANVDSLRFQEDWYRVIGGEQDEGCVIVSQLSDPVSFTSLIADRTVNVVPVASVDAALRHFDSYTQTVGVFPESAKAELVDVAPLYGAQRFISLGYSAHHTWAGPHDGLELDRRMVKWIVEQRAEPFPLAYAGSKDRVRFPVSTPGTLDAVRAA